MTEKISNIILEIESKFFALKEKLNAETSRNEQLSTELQSLRAAKDSMANTISALESDLNKLKQENEELKEKNESVPALVNGHDKDMEIDFLVREIDQCISQIKNNL